MLYSLAQSINIMNTRLKDSVDRKKFILVKNNLIKLLYLVNSFGTLVGVDLDDSFDIVHRSNMTKLCVSEDEAKSTVNWYKNNDKRYSSPNYKKNKFGYVIFNEETGKILKSINYIPANFDSILTKYSLNNENYNIKNKWYPNEFSI